MDTNDFLGSFADENIAFNTQVIRTGKVGDNYWKVMVFVENDRWVDATQADWVLIPGSTTMKALSVTASNYASYMKTVSDGNLLSSWLYDLFCNGFTGDCILVACAAKPNDDDDEGAHDAFIAAMETAYDSMRAYAYHKTVCAGSDTGLNPEIAVALAAKCKVDKGLLSSAPYYPFTSATPATVSSDTIYSALKTAGEDAFMSCHADTTHNGALFSLGLALANLNGSGTAVGTSMDMIKTNMITPSGVNGANLPKTTRDVLYASHVQSFKPVGDNTGYVAAMGDQTINGDIIAATWIIAYVTYMSKVSIAKMITVPNFLKNAINYGKIVGVPAGYLSLFGEAGSGRLSNINITAPAFADLPASAGDEIIIPGAWSAVYTDHVRTVRITGSLYIGE